MSLSIDERAAIYAQKLGIDLGIKHHFTDFLYAKEMVIPEGAEVIQHRHNYAHFGLLGMGAVIVKIDGEEDKVHVAPSIIELKAGIHHGIVAIEDSIWFCIHQTDVKDETIVDDALIERGK